MNNTKYKILSSVLPAGSSVQAASTVSPSSTITLTINNIINHTHPGDFSGINISGEFILSDETETYGFGSIITGTADSSPTYLGGDSDTLNIGSSLTQAFSAAGKATDGILEAYYQAYGSFIFSNNSTDHYTIEYSLGYSLEAEVAGDLADSEIVLTLSNEQGNIDEYIDATASTLLQLTDQNIDLINFSLELNGNSSEEVDVNTSITAYAKAVAPVPVPAAG